MKPFRCQICGETYLGEEAPDRCPFCGAAGHYMVSAAEWIDYGALQLSDKTKEYLYQSLDIELSNTAFYKTCAAKSETRITQAIFKRLMKQEQEHADLISKLMGVPTPAGHDEDAPEMDADKFGEAHFREKRATKLYEQITDEAPELRIKEVFRALMEIEGEHLKVSNIYK